MRVRATEADFAGRPDLVRGYVGPQGLGEKVRYIADPRVAPGTAWMRIRKTRAAVT